MSKWKESGLPHYLRTRGRVGLHQNGPNSAFTRYVTRTANPLVRAEARRGLTQPCTVPTAKRLSAGRFRNVPSPEAKINTFSTQDHAKRKPGTAQAGDQGLLSRAASQLCSRGIAPENADTFKKIEARFPEGALPLNVSGLAAPTIEVAATTVKKIILSSPKRLAAGCSGLSAEHVRAVRQDRNAGRAGSTLELLTKFANMCEAICLLNFRSCFFVQRPPHTTKQEG